MPEECNELVATSEPTVRMKDFVEFLIYNMSEAEQNEAIKVIVETISADRADRLKVLTVRIEALYSANSKLEDILKANS